MLDVQPGDAAVIANGRITRVFTADPDGDITEELVAEDFQLLQLLLGKYRMGIAIAAGVQSMLTNNVLQVWGANTRIHPCMLQSCCSGCIGSFML